MKPPDPLIIETTRDMQCWADGERAEGRHIGLVPTMGGLHPGHVSLVRIAQRYSQRVVVSIFVNPTQFGPGEDYARYPRDRPADVRLLRGVGTDVVFAPPVEEIYPEGDATRVSVSRLTDGLCGHDRPGHFDGVTTVVPRLFQAVKPHLVVFGEKDYQQLVVVRRMARDLLFDVEILSAPTVREPDGLAMSSRNAYLSPAARQQASALNAALAEVRNRLRAGERDVRALLECARKRLAKEPLAEIDYIDIRGAKNLEILETIDRRAVMALAVRFEGARLIDNTMLEVGE